MLLIGILRIDWLINVSANTTSFFYESALLEVVFQNHAWKLGVRLIHECGLYTNVYGTLYLIKSENMKYFTVPFLNYKAQKLLLREFLAGHTVAMVMLSLKIKFNFYLNLIFNYNSNLLCHKNDNNMFTNDWAVFGYHDCAIKW